MSDIGSSNKGSFITAAELARIYVPDLLTAERIISRDLSKISSAVICEDRFDAERHFSTSPVWSILLDVCMWAFQGDISFSFSVSCHSDSGSAASMRQCYLPGPRPVKP